MATEPAHILCAVPALSQAVLPCLPAHSLCAYFLAFLIANFFLSEGSSFFAFSERDFFFFF